MEPQHKGNDNDPAEHDPSSTRVRPDQVKQSAESAPPPSAAEPASPGSAHMGAVEDDVIREKPPTDVLNDLLKEPHDQDDVHGHAPHDELTPG